MRIVTSLVSVVVVGLLLLAGAAAGVDDGSGVAHASADPIITAQAPQQQERGKTVFANVCAECHGDNGEGAGDFPRLIGTPNGLATHQTALRLFQFVSTEMPPERPKLKPEEYWDVLAYVLRQNRLLPDNTVLGPDNAANIRTAP